jgi:hypothetical protein
MSQSTHLIADPALCEFVPLVPHPHPTPRAAPPPKSLAEQTLEAQVLAIRSSVNVVLEACRQALMFQVDVTREGAEDNSEEVASTVNEVINGLATRLQEKVGPVAVFFFIRKELM